MSKEATIKHYFTANMTGDTRFALTEALMNLYSGPGNVELGFDSATRILKNWWDEQPHRVFYNQDTDEVEESEPEEDDYIIFSGRELKRIVFGRDLAEYI